MPPDKDESQPKKRKVVGLRVPGREFALVELLAEHRRTTVSDLIRESGWNDLVKAGEELADRLNQTMRSSA